MSVPIVRIDKVFDHPNAERLSINVLDVSELNANSVICISNKVDGQHRYKEGDLVAYLAPGCVLPEWLLKRLDMWDEKNNRGFLGGGAGNIVERVKLRGEFSEGTMYPTEKLSDGIISCRHIVESEDGSFHYVHLGDDAAKFLGVQ